MTRKAIVREITNLCRRARLDDYDAFRDVTRQVRLALGLKRPRGPRRLPHLLTDDQLRAYYRAVDEGGDLKHQILLRLLLFTAIRVSELCGIRVEDVDLRASKIFIEQGKGEKDRYILFPDPFRLLLQAYLETVPDNRHLFESRHRRPYSPRRIQQIVVAYAQVAGIESRVHPHLFRHQMLTFLTPHMPDSAIQLISGHSSKKGLERYQHMSLDQAQEGYQKAVRELGID